jgi:prolyl-tRNA editing enzyme YbaK/EbsC (Cys-tRNA(Pro) deacylase)
MSMEPITQVGPFLRRQGLEPREFATPTPTVAAAAQAVGCSEAEIAKTLLIEIGGEPLAVLACGDARINTALARQASGLRGKLNFPPRDRVTVLTGYAPGAVCPFLLPEGLALYLDRSLERFTWVYPAAGSRNSSVAVPVGRLEQLTGGKWGRLCKIPGREGTEE